MIRHPSGEGWIDDHGEYLCAGCVVLGSHEHRCHRDDFGLACSCEACHPSPEDLIAFMESIGLPLDQDE